MRKVIKLKIASQMFNDVAFVSHVTTEYIKNFIDTNCRFGWRGPISVKQVFYEAEGFMSDVKPLLVSFDYIPTPRIFRTTPKKKRKLINRYL